MTRTSGSMGALTTRVRPAPRRTWRELIAVDPDALPTQSPEWLDSLCADGRYVDASRCYELQDGRRALLPLVRRTHRANRASTLASMPASWGFGGLLVEGGVTVEAVSAVVDDLVGQGALRVRLRPNPLHSDVWTAAMAGRRGVTATPSCAHVLDLGGGFDAVWEQRFKATTRSQVRKAERMGVVVETDTTGRLLPELHALLRTSVDRWASRQHEPARMAQLRFARRDPPAKLRAIAEHLGGSCRVSVARIDGVAVAAILVLQGRNAHYTRGAMDEELASHSQATKLLHKVAIEAACEAGCDTYHMGESGESAGLSQFKSRFGAVAQPYHEYVIERVPLTRLDQLARSSVKRVLGFQDA
ncbi:GNAT family N-acetyltransferase [Nocardioides terrigena]|uniref:GNAT family N-acetyltransferase n=1 Tax=Nocardioides terrigena TaxID=424797 RepID=UPI00131F4353|nr:GNAT family N-acetyltransferase [Nocardioides terrigena]